ncbi:MAG: DeoR/GlpR family DNA-binding transcription regulator [Peptoniphilaceae bacterium]|nr:DeoR/GlpR family DNA-binding transcription regulator [Peptoniphilaceae bacterium]MDY6018360.1 DeoR/GlpR family DNA-binding transcription regulator [Anaerococcus sp.]
MNKDRSTMMAEYILKKGEATIDELANLFDVSIVTVRRDLRKLEKENLIEKIYGGAKSKSVKLQTFDQRSNLYFDEKKEICKLASKYIKDGNSIFIDSGTTVRYLLMDIDKKIHITLITNNLYIINEIRDMPNIELYIVGNYYLRLSNSFIYRTNTNDLLNFNIDKAFMAASSISIKNGLANNNPLEQQIKKKICTISDKKYLLADSSKFDKSSLLTFARLEDIDTVFTNKPVKEEYFDFFKENGVKCIYPNN